MEYVWYCWPPLWSSGQSSWLHIQRSGFDSRRCHIFWEVVGLERSPLSLVSTIEDPLWRKSGGSGPESREYFRRDPARWPRGTLYPQKLARSAPFARGLRPRSFLRDIVKHWIFDVQRKKISPRQTKIEEISNSFALRISSYLMFF
jgi:hypothetical protein